MGTETEISICYEAELAEIADLDRIYYLNAAASRADRAAYYRPQDQLEQSRSRLYAKLGAARKKGQNHSSHTHFRSKNLDRGLFLL
jgi:hypothetical protein